MVVCWLNLKSSFEWVSCARSLSILLKHVWRTGHFAHSEASEDLFGNTGLWCQTSC